jgi:hypothetical protein
MKDKRCAPIRRELEELMVSDEFSATAAGHLQTCSDCREFQRQQMKLRQLVGSLGTVSAPADFDFRLRARLAADAEVPSFRFWSVTVKGLATAAVLLVFGVGAVVVWQRTREQRPNVAPAVAEAPPQVAAPGRPEESNNREAGSLAHGRESTPVVADITAPRRIDRPRYVNRPKQPVSTIDSSRNVFRSMNPAVEPAAVFPIEASSQWLRVSLDDGRGNARTIAFPGVSFGSQRVSSNANQLAPKDVW